MPFYVETDGVLQMRPEMLIEHPPQGHIPRSSRVPYALITEAGAFLTAETVWIGREHWVVRYRWNDGREQSRLSIRSIASGFGGAW
jgi:hypothetical protein